jgi:hypothetical protein
MSKRLGACLAVILALLPACRGRRGRRRDGRLRQRRLHCALNDWLLPLAQQ